MFGNGTYPLTRKNIHFRFIFVGELSRGALGLASDFDFMEFSYLMYSFYFVRSNLPFSYSSKFLLSLRARRHKVYASINHPYKRRGGA
jgi:hypothetical protein